MSRYATTDRFTAIMARSHTQRRNEGQRAAYRATHEILSKPPRKPWWKFWVKK